jgi:hypothetical protein
MIENHEEIKNNIVEDYIRYVSEIIKKYNESSSLIYKNEINPQDINKALASYIEVSSILIEEYQRRKINLYEIQKEYDIWYNKKFVDVRNQMIKDTESKTIKNSLKEIEILLKYQWESEYYKWQDKITKSEYQVSFMRRILDTYKKFDNILVCLSNNLRQEMKTLNLDNRMSYDNFKTSELKRR